MVDPDINKSYVSPIDQFLRDFDMKHEKSASQIKEIEKHQWIAKRRDEAIPQSALEDPWVDF